MGDGHQLLHAGGETAAAALGVQMRQINAVAGEDLLRQPARAAAAILPDILEDVGHLQALRKGWREARQCGAMLFNIGRVGAEKFSEHLTDDAGDVVAVTVEVRHGIQAANRSRCAGN